MAQPYLGNPAMLGVAASGLGLDYYWYKVSGGTTNAVGANSQYYVVPSLAASDEADYYVGVSNAAAMVTSQIAHIGVNTTPTAPVVTVPNDTTNYVGDTVKLAGSAAGTGPLSFQWLRDNTAVVDGPSALPGDTSVISGSQTPTLSIVNVSTNESGTYKLVVTGAVAPAGSGSTKVTILPPRSVSVGYLRSLVDTNWQTTDTTTLYGITGVITVLTNLSNGQSSYYIQDDTGGLNLFVGGTTSFRPNMGDIVRAVGTLSTFSDNLELISSPVSVYQTHDILGHTSILPAPIVFYPDWTNNLPLMETNLEGRIIMLTNIYFTNMTATGAGQTTVNVTNSSGMSFLVFFPGGQDADVRNKPKPAFAWTITGVLNQFPPSSLNGVATKVGYEVLVSRWQDVVTNAPPAVTIQTTRSGNDMVLNWTAAPPYSDSSIGAYCYSVYASPNVIGPYLPLVTGLTFTNTLGTYKHVNGALSGMQFYRVSSP